MGELAVRKWAAMRELHEVWGAPLNLLQQVTELADGGVQTRARIEGWAVNQSSLGLHARLIKVFEGQLAHFRDTKKEGDEEKRARSLSVMAKTLETIATVGIKLAQVSQEHSDPKNGALDEPTSGFGTDERGQSLSTADRTAELDRALTELVGGLVQRRGLE